MKPVEYYKDRQQTYLKHLFLEQYLETAAYHIGYSHKEFAYVDCFSGPWRTADEELGDTSIRIALDRLNSVRNGLAKMERYPKIRAIFVEKSPTAFVSLQQVLQEHRGDIKTVALPGSFEENIPGILDQVGSTFAFFFVDPIGWSGFSMDNLRPILKRGNGEVMINFMYDPIDRFLGFQNVANEESLDRCFGTPNWRPIRDAPDRESALVSLYMEQVRGTGDFPYVTSSRILKPLQDRAYFHLIYATRNPKGMEEFRNVERKVVTAQEDVRARAQREHREQRSGQPEFDFASELPSNAFRLERSKQLVAARAKILQLLQEGPLQYEVLQPVILQLRLVRNRDLNSILMEMQKVGQIQIHGLGPRERTPKPGYTVSLRS
ncbi:MAG: three-Cys-motif partner protein TcmP [Acidobacteriota bacterium]